MRRRSARDLRAVASDHLCVAEAGDFVGMEAEFRQHFLGMLPELGRRSRNPARRARQRYRLADDAQLAPVTFPRRLRNIEMLDLWIVEHLVDGIDWAAGHAGRIEPLDPFGACAHRSATVDLEIERIAIFQA